MSDIEDLKQRYGPAIESLRRVFDSNGVKSNRITFLCVVALRLHAIKKLNLLTEDPETVCALSVEVANSLSALKVEDMNAQWDDAQPLLPVLSRDFVDESHPGVDANNLLPRLA